LPADRQRAAARARRAGPRATIAAADQRVRVTHVRVETVAVIGSGVYDYRSED